MPIATFVMPSIHQQFIRESIRSLQLQTIKDWELIIFNNNAKYKYKFKDKRIRLINTGYNKPLVECFNEAHKIAKSNVILHQCDDDVSMPERLAVVLHYMKDYDADVVFGSFFGMNAKGGLLYYKDTPAFDPEIHRLYGTLTSLSFAGYRRDRCPDYRYEFFYLHDWAWVWDCWLMGLTMASTPCPLGFRRAWGKQMSKDRWRDPLVQEEEEIARLIYDDNQMRRKAEVKMMKFPKVFYGIPQF